MPVYTYRCQSCGVQLEKTQKFSDRPLTRCPECRRGRLRRLIQPSAIIFKGFGWYTTDHGSASRQGSRREPEDISDTSKRAADTADAKPTKKEHKSSKADG